VVCNRPFEKPFTEFHKNGKASYCKPCIIGIVQVRNAKFTALRLEILTFQGNRCAICQISLKDGNLDHGHACEKHKHSRGALVTAVIASCPCVRGVLCGDCNSKLMFYIDSGLALPGPEVQYYLDNPPAQLYFELLEEWEAA
jgi:hypothetical protein